MPWLRRFSLHLAAAVGATGIFVAAAAVGAQQNRTSPAAQTQTAVVQRTRTPVAPRASASPPAVPSPDAAGTPVTAGPPAPQAAPGVSVSASPSAAPPRATRTPATAPVNPERSLAGTIRGVEADAIVVLGNGGKEWRVTPVPGALIRLKGKTAKLDALQVDDRVVILGQAQRGADFTAHAITAVRK